MSKLLADTVDGDRLPDFDDVRRAAARVTPSIHKTALLSSSLLNHWLGHTVLFKAECLQVTGAFKVRGALNTILWLRENRIEPRRIVTNSSGNHAQAVAWAAGRQGIPTTIFMPADVSAVKAQATAAYGADIVFCDDRVAVDSRVQEEALEDATYWIPPYNHTQVMAGQGSATLEALQEAPQVDALFAPCGGGGLLSGALLATRALSPQSKVIGAEPLNANDAVESRRMGSIQELNGTPKTIADGAKTLSVGNLTFEFIKQLDALYEIRESQIIYWTQWLQHLLKLHVEPTSAMTMGAVVRWLADQQRPRTVLVMLSGGNIDQSTMSAVWAESCLDQQPSLERSEL